MKYEYEAVSGNQEVFKHDKDGSSHTASISNEGELHFWRTKLKVFGDIIAERKVTEKYIPKAGDVFRMIQPYDHGELLCLKSNDNGVAFEYLNKDQGHFDSVGSALKFEFIRKHDDKAANPVNFTSEKYVPRVGDVFAAVSKKHGINPYIFKCTEVEGRLNDSGYSYEVFGKKFLGATGHCNTLDSDFILIERPSTK